VQTRLALGFVAWDSSERAVIIPGVPPRANDFWRGRFLSAILTLFRRRSTASAYMYGVPLAGLDFFLQHFSAERLANFG
jgi:hypothetical protein